MGNQTMIEGTCVGYTICMLQSWCCLSSFSGVGYTRGWSSQSWRKRSNRPLECSGPCPSYPCGKLITKPVRCSHFLSPEAINWSMMHCALLAKSPNWASQMVNESGETSEYPSSNPSAPNSDRDELQTLNLAWKPLRSSRGVYCSSVFWS